MGAAPFFKGKNCIVQLFIGGAPVGDDIAVKSFSAKPNVTTIADGVGGEDRDRLDVEVNFYELKIECFAGVDPQKLLNLLADQENVDAGGMPTSKQFAMVIKPANGGKAGFKGTEATVDDWEFAFSGRVDRAMITIPVRCRYFRPVATI